MNPSLFLAREVQTPLKYTRGDGRLNNNTQSQNQSTNLYLFSSALVFFFSFIGVLREESFDPRGPRGERTDLGQPIAVVRPDGFHPGRVGFRVQKDLTGCLAYRASDEAPPVMCLAYHGRCRRYT